MASSAGAFKDVLLAIAIVGGVLGGLYAFTGVWPPMVVVESGSMMHAVCTSPGTPDYCDPSVGYGKIGTIDPGDMVFVQKVNQRSDVTTMADGFLKNPTAKNYGKPGDVVVYFPYNKRTSTPIIHRAIAWVQVDGVDATSCQAGQPQDGASYQVQWYKQAADGTYVPDVRNFGPDGVYFPEVGFGAPYSQSSGWKPCWSGFITKGDNPVTNTRPDQALSGPTLPKDPVRIDWVEGKAVGELPWFGLIKLALSSSPNYLCSSGGFAVGFTGDPACTQAVRILNANAPADLWVMLGISLAVIAIAPLGYDMWLLRRQKQRQEMEARGETPPPTLGELLKQRLLKPGGEAAPEGPPAPPPYNPPPPPAAPPTGNPPPGTPPGPGTQGKSGAKFERVDKK